VLVEALAKSRRVKEDSALGVVFPAMFTLGVFVISKLFSNVHIDTDAVLYCKIAFASFDTLLIGGRDYGPKALWVLGGTPSSTPHSLQCSINHWCYLYMATTNKVL
jgi:manganese/zinc/iron transport system permease protein